jgi:hypothetical protein
MPIGLIFYTDRFQKSHATACLIRDNVILKITYEKSKGIMKTKIAIYFLSMPLFLFGCQSQPTKPINTASNLQTTQANSQKSIVLTENTIKEFLNKYDAAFLKYDWRELARMRGDITIEENNRLRKETMAAKSKLKSEKITMTGIHRTNLRINIQQHSATFFSNKLTSLLTYRNDRKLTYISKQISKGTIELINGKLLLVDSDESLPLIEPAVDMTKLVEKGKQNASQKVKYFRPDAHVQEQSGVPNQSEPTSPQESELCKRAKALRDYYRKQLRKPRTVQLELRDRSDPTLLSERDVATIEHEYYSGQVLELCY